MTGARRGAGLHGLRGLEDASAAMVALIGERYGRMPIIMGVIVGLVTTVALSLAGPSALLVDNYMFPLSFMFTLLTIAFVSVAGNLARELETGEVALYTYTRLGRAGYVVSWIAAVVLQVAVIIFISITLPILFYAPYAMLNSRVLVIEAAILLQLLYHALLLVTMALLARSYRRYLNMALGFFLILPFGTGMLLSVLASADMIDFDTVDRIFGVIGAVTYPLFDVLESFFTNKSVMATLAYTTLAVVILPVALLAYASRRMEV